MRFFGVLFVIIFHIVSGAVYRSPNNDDTKYWRDYGEKHLKEILNSQGIDRVKVARNVLYFVGDGMSFATITAGRILKGQKNKRSGEESEFIFEKFPHLGLSKTYNTDKQVSDSAGTATALFTGVKTNIGGICLNPASDTNFDRLSTIIDWAQAENKRTGIVTNTRITHATPACTYAYAKHRNYECDTHVPEALLKTKYKDIARQLVEEKPGKLMNVIYGGGRDFLGAPKVEKPKKYVFLGGGEKSCNRTDKINLVDKYLSQFDNKTNVKYVTNTGEMVDIDYENADHVLGLFANNHMEYEIVRDKGSDGQPSLTEMVKSAIRVLDNKKNKNGWLLMVEGGKIDQAHHQNHARAALEEMVEFENAIREVTEKLDDDTLVIVTADHSHSMVFNGYAPRGQDIFGLANNLGAAPYETLIYATGPGYEMHHINGTEIPLANFTEEQRASPTYMHASLITMYDGGHTGDDVGVFSKGHGSNLIQGAFEQSYIPYVVSFASCIGPAKHLNPECSEKYRYKVEKVPAAATSGGTTSKNYLNILAFITLFAMTLNI